MRVAVTGAAGFLGTNLAAQLLEEGHEVVAVDRRLPPSSDPRLRWVTADVLDRRALGAAFRDVEIVFHLAAIITLAQDHPRAWEVNTTGVATCARAALDAGVRRFIHCSSVHAFDQRAKVVDEDSPRATDPRLPVYNRSKWTGECRLREVMADGLDAVICHPTGIYGPGDAAMTRLNSLIRLAAGGMLPLTVEGGFDLIDVRDVANGFVLASRHGRTGDNYLLSGTWMSIAELCRRGAEVTGARPPRGVIPMGVIRSLRPLAEPLSRVFHSDMISPGSISTLTDSPRIEGAKARAEIHHTSRPAEDTIADLVRFLYDVGRLPIRPRAAFGPGGAGYRRLPTPPRP